MKGTKAVNRNKARTRNVLVVTAMAAVLIVGGISAYFTSTDSADNTWTVGSVSVELQEPGYDAAADERTAITPNQTLTKDPKVSNDGDNPAYIFMKFSVPKASVKVASADGTQVSQTVQELFEYTVSDEWTRISTTEGENSNTYVYTYGTATACESLEPEAATPVLFEDSQITFKNVIEGQGLEGTTLTIPVEAYAIQTADITDDDLSAPEAVWKVLNDQLDAE